MNTPADVRDYLQTQGLKLPASDVQVACIAAETVMAQAQAAIDSAVLWYGGRDGLAAHLPRTPEHETLLRQIFLALDAAADRHPPAFACIYLKQRTQLLKLCGCGLPAADILPLTDEADPQPVQRTAQNGWLCLIDDTAHWQANGELPPQTAAPPSGSLLAAPVCGSSGNVSGVLLVGYPDAQDWPADTLCPWLGLAVALHPVLYRLQQADAGDPENG